MRFKKLTGLFIVVLAAYGTVTFAYQKPDVSGVKPQGKQEQLVPVEFITAQELKAKIAKNETLAILDLRAEGAYSQSDKTIKGSVHLKVRRVTIRCRVTTRDKKVLADCSCRTEH